MPFVHFSFKLWFATNFKSEQPEQRRQQKMRWSLELNECWFRCAKGTRIYAFMQIKISQLKWRLLRLTSIALYFRAIVVTKLNVVRKVSQKRGVGHGWDGKRCNAKIPKLHHCSHHPNHCIWTVHSMWIGRKSRLNQWVHLQHLHIAPMQNCVCVGCRRKQLAHSTSTVYYRLEKPHERISAMMELLYVSAKLCRCAIRFSSVLTYYETHTKSHAECFLSHTHTECYTRLKFGKCGKNISETNLN